ncbi:Deoxyribonuclease TATDN1 [Oopsacas minuta]|uniref:Deoxyribonuclease TATDN1 n=1 Tax=Oopsacas minuta TaxID=111878 RepID=A0AAV7JKA9_9METZ|nr:Deoxyribonuclease TATDN1 [Oopsacas minuta]
MASKLIRGIVDIGVNLTDPVYQGVYYKSKHHPPDLDRVLVRTEQSGITQMIITGGCLSESREALELATTSNMLYSTVGCHPTRCLEFETCKEGPAAYLASLRALVMSNRESGKIVAVGETGLDFDRLNFCPKEIQIKHFEPQILLSIELGLPLFLHCRNAFNEFHAVMKKHITSCHGGVVHSFTGSLDEAIAFTDMGLYIGINGCSLKTEDNIKVVSGIPLDKMMVETDAPWCEIRQTHASYKFIKTQFPAVKKEKWSGDKMVKSRNEPCKISQVLEVIAAIKGCPIDLVIEKTYENTKNMFFPKL